ncbi:SNF2-related protein, partial [Cynara cardunculus var. scolymus]
MMNLQLTQVQLHENQMNSQMQTVNLQSSMATMQQNNMRSLQQNSVSSNAQQNMMRSIQPNSNLDSGQNSTMNSWQQSGVEKGLPPKKETILKVGMSQIQKQYYKALLHRDLE